MPTLRTLIAVLCVAGQLAAAACSDDPRPPRRPTENENETDAERYGPPRVAGRVQIEVLTELSGLTASLEHPRRLWAHNDSGGEPVLYCITPRGDACGSVRLEGALNVDWEDIAGRRERAAGILYVADIGDNDRVRESVTIYRIEEPDSAAGSVAVETFDLEYPRRAFDAEAIVVEPSTEDLYVVTKDFAGRPDVFVARGPLGSATTLEPVGSVRLAGPLAVVTGASLDPTGERVVLSTYATGYELTLPAGEPFDEIWSQEPVSVDLGSHTQGEAVAYLSSGDIVSASEGPGSPIYTVEYLARP